MEYLYLLAGLVLILAGANYLTDGSVALAERFRVPGFLIGLTIVAVGTSTPELVVSFLSALEGEGDMAVGNVVGSNLFNVFIILGVCALIRPLPLTRQNIRRDLPVGVAASLVLCAVLADEVLDPTHPARIGRIEGLAMLLLYVLSVWTAARAARKEQPAEDTPAARPIAGWLMTLMIVGGLAALVFGGEIFLHNAVAIARKLGVSESVIAITWRAARRCPNWPRRSSRSSRAGPTSRWATSWDRTSPTSCSSWGSVPPSSRSRRAASTP